MAGRNPDSLLYSATHEWIEREGDTVTIGITDHAQTELGDIVFLELPEPGTRLSREDSFGSIESVKAVSELYMPVSGTISMRNEALIASPEKVNSDPYGEGWMVRVKLSDPAEIDTLLDSTGYRNSL